MGGSKATEKSSVLGDGGFCYNLQSILTPGEIDDQWVFKDVGSDLSLGWMARPVNLFCFATATENGDGGKVLNSSEVVSLPPILPTLLRNSIVKTKIWRQNYWLVADTTIFIFKPES